MKFQTFISFEVLLIMFSPSAMSCDSRASAKFRSEFCARLRAKLDKVIDLVGPDEWNRMKRPYMDAWISTVDIDSRGDPLAVSAHYSRLFRKLEGLQSDFPYIFVYYWYEKVTAELFDLPKVLYEIDRCYDMMRCEIDEVRSKQSVPPEKKQKIDE